MNIEYILTGRFYEGIEDSDASFLEQSNSERLLAEVKCDVQRDASGYRSVGDSMFFLYNVFTKSLPVSVKEGCIFRCNAYGANIDGVILSIFRHSMGVELKVKDIAINDNV